MSEIQQDEMPLWRWARPPYLDVLAVGENSVDQTLRVECAPLPGGKVEILDEQRGPGGQVATAAIACARLGLTCQYLGSVGDDDEAEVVLDALLEAGVDTRAVRRVPGVRTRSAVVIVEEQTGKRTVYWRQDDRLLPKVIDSAFPDLAAVGVVLLDATDPAFGLWVARRARRLGVPVVLDADRFTADLEPLLESVDFPIVSDSFCDEFGGSEAYAAVLAELEGRGARLAAVTLGERGAIARNQGRNIESPAFLVDEVVDDTGAGDAFRAGFAWGLRSGFGGIRALRAANVTAALSCQGPGAQGGLPDLEQLEVCLARPVT
ncbi:carbohydrate kinase family protein [Myxococcota bacterium]|nr:carbohydrate kinase family protein [Myxococcota bacterium]